MATVAAAMDDVKGDARRGWLTVGGDGGKWLTAVVAAAADYAGDWGPQWAAAAAAGGGGGRQRRGGPGMILIGEKQCRYGFLLALSSSH